MKKNLTYHASTERNDRLNFIVEHIGIGEEFSCGMPKACVVYKRAMHYDGARLPRSMVEKINYNAKLEKKFHIGG